MQKGLSSLKVNIPNHNEHKEYLINKLADEFQKHIDIGLILEDEK